MNVAVLAVLPSGGSSAKLPDLIVEDFGWMPAHPKLGDRVLFSARIKKIGQAPTPDGTVCGVAFSIGSGNPMFSSDKYKKSVFLGGKR